MKILVFFYLVMFSTGCMRIVDKNAMDQRPGQSYFHSNSLPVRTYSTEVQNGIYLNLQSENRPGFYSLYFQFPEPSQNYRIELLTQVPGQQVLSSREFSQNSLSLPHSHDYEIEIWKQNRGGPQRVAFFQGRTPKDVVFSTPQTLSKSQSVEAFRVFFLNDANLRIYQHHLKISAFEVISESPITIKSFAEIDQALPDQKGLDSGYLQIQAEAIFGYFKFVLRGQKGGDGSDAPQHISRAKRGDPAFLGQIRRDPDGNYFCFGKQSSNGSGQPGAVGHPGKNGKAGGRGGVLSINVKNTQHFAYEYHLAGGTSGKATLGGAGQLGGLPGETGGSGLQNAHCGLPKMLGVEGPTGPRGPDGAVESPGSHGNLCFNLNSQQVRCLSVIP